MSSAETPIRADQAGAADEAPRRRLALLTEALGDAVAGSHIEKGDLWVRVRCDGWRRAAEVCREALGCDYFCFLSGIDWMPSSVPNPEEAAEAGDEAEPSGRVPTEPAEQRAATPEEGAGWTTGYAGGDTRFQVLARYYSTAGHYGITLKADLDDQAPTVESVSAVYAGANWHERETWEMFGFDFVGHPHLGHLYLPGAFEGHPLRKDFPLLAREVKPWPGLVDVEPMPGEEGEGEGGET